MIINQQAITISEIFADTRARTEQLCAPLKVEDYVPQPVTFVSPAKWHLGHTTWFFEEFILKPEQQNYQLFNDDFAYVFNSYYNTVGDRVLRADRGNLTRPTVEEVYAYRAYVTNALIQFLDAGNVSEEVRSLVELGINHEEQHQELLITDLKYTLGTNPLFPVYSSDFSLVHQQSRNTGFTTIEEGVYSIGHNSDAFCYDNELGRHKVFLDQFEISNALVTNGEFLEFINDNGYGRFELWLDEGWSWVNENNIDAPLYWHKINGAWHNYTLAGLLPVDPNDVLCHISYFEAAAFAEWKQMRLPTEFEWEIASEKLSWGQRWEWTNSAYLAYPKFAKPDGAVGEYNGKFMINQMVLRGGSTATAPGHSRHTYRNFFHPQYRWQCTGIRLAKR